MFPMSDVGYLFCPAGDTIVCMVFPHGTTSYLPWLHTNEPGLPGVGLYLAGQLRDTQGSEAGAVTAPGPGSPWDPESGAQ